MWNVTCANVSKTFRFFLFSNDLAFRKAAKFQRPKTFPASTRERGYLLLQVFQCTRQVHPGRQGRSPVMAEKPALTWLGSADLQPWCSDPTSYLTTGRGWVARYIQKGPGRLLTVLSRLPWPHFIESQISRMEEAFLHHLVLYSLYKRENRGTEKRDDLLKVTRQVVSNVSSPDYPSTVQVEYSWCTRWDFIKPPEDTIGDLLWSAWHLSRYMHSWRVWDVTGHLSSQLPTQKPLVVSDSFTAFAPDWFAAKHIHIYTNICMCVCIYIIFLSY